MFDIRGYTLRTLFHSQIQEVIREAIRSTIQLTSLENQEQEDRPQTYKQSMKHNRTSVILQETHYEVKIIGKEIEISQIDCTISTHGNTNTLSITTMTKTKK
jgi:hypothetical protein